MLIATPEYNSSIPGVLKNALDWASRPLAESPVLNKPVAVLSSSTGMFGGVWAAAETRKVLGALGARTLEDTVAVPKADQRLAERRRRDAARRAAHGRRRARDRGRGPRPDAGRRLGRQEALDGADGVVERVPEHRVPGGDARRPGAGRRARRRARRAGGRTGCTRSRRARAASGSGPARTAAAAASSRRTRRRPRSGSSGSGSGRRRRAAGARASSPATSSRGAVVSTLSS